MTAAEIERFEALVERMDLALARIEGDLGIHRTALRLVETCVECGREWLDRNERWKTYLTNDDEPALYCPECAEREFRADDA